VGLDHVVAFSPDLDRTVAALEGAGLDLRRIREGPTPGGAMRQAFFRIGEPLLEVIEAPPDSPLRQRPDARPRLWGLAFVVDDLDACARILGDRLGEPRAAVQEGRRIASARRSAELGAPVAFITPALPLRGDQKEKT
jgi:catechol 2,3-dioxygenase-like lactoylglutathione lyase family enzyme